MRRIWKKCDGSDWHRLCFVCLEEPKKGVALADLEIIAFAELFFAIFSTILRKVRQAIVTLR
jgi:hypothetical protein